MDSNGNFVDMATKPNDCFYAGLRLDENGDLRLELREKKGEHDIALLNKSLGRIFFYFSFEIILISLPY